MPTHTVRPVLLACALSVPIAAQSQPMSVTPSTASSLLKLRAGVFDPLESQPATSDLLRSTNEHGLWILQFVASPSSADRQAIANLGGEIVSYLPDNAYVVRMPASMAHNANSIATVRWVGSYEVSYRIDPDLLAKRVYEDATPVRYNIVVANKHTDKPALGAKVAAAGGKVDNLQFGSILMEVTLTGPQLLLVAGFNEVLWIDRWTPIEVDMDNARIQGGGDYLENADGLHRRGGQRAHLRRHRGGASRLHGGGHQRAQWRRGRPARPRDGGHRVR